MTISRTDSPEGSPDHAALQRIVRSFLEARLSVPFADETESRSLIRALVEDAPEEAWMVAADGSFPWFDAAAARLLEGEPVQYITGIAPFYGLFFRVSPDVLIPRPETEELVFQALQYLKSCQPGAKVLDIGTGSGCIALTLSIRVPGIEVDAWDFSRAALDVARQNENRLGGQVQWRFCNALSEDSWPIEARYHLIVSNPPYIARDETGHMDERVIRHEPHQALFPTGEDALIFYRVMAEKGRKALYPGGRLLCECSTFTAQEVCRLFEDAGWKTVRCHQDIQGLDRLVEATCP